VQRDLRTTPLYQEIERHFLRIHEPAFGKTSWAFDAQASPDGTRIAFTGSRWDKLEGTPNTRICVADVASGTFQEATAGPHDDRSPRWSPDSSRLAFLSDRAERHRTQLYLLEAGRMGEAVATPVVDHVVEYLSWSPDGERILLGVAGAGADLAGVEGSGRAGREDQAGAPPWLPTVDSTEATERWRRAWVYDVNARRVDPASREGLNVWEAAWCGQEDFSAIGSEGPAEDLWYVAVLALIDADTGKERVLYRSEHQLGLPAGSPSGGRLAVLEALCSDRWVVAGDIVLVDPATGAPTRVDTNGVDVTHQAWRDDDHLAYVGIRGLDTVFGEYDAATGAATDLWVTTESCGDLYPTFSVAGPDALATVVQGYERFAEVTLLQEVKPNRILALEHDGSRYLSEVAGRLERVAWSAPDGLEIQGFVAVPERPGPHPMVTMVHGGPVAAYTELWGMRSSLGSLLVSRGFAVFYPNPRGSSGRGQAFAAMVDGDMGGADVGDILSGIDALVQRGVADPARLGVAGGSYGGFMSTWITSRTDRFAAAAAISPVTDWYSQHFTSNIGFWDADFLQASPTEAGNAYFERSPVFSASKVRTPTLVTAGLLDQCTPPGQAVEFYRALVEQGVEAALVQYPHEGHGVRNFPAAIDLCTRVVGWFERFMPPGAPEA